MCTLSPDYYNIVKFRCAEFSVKQSFDFLSKLYFFQKVISGVKIIFSERVCSKTVKIKTVQKVRFRSILSKAPNKELF